MSSCQNFHHFLTNPRYNNSTQTVTVKRETSLEYTTSYQVRFCNLFILYKASDYEKAHNKSKAPSLREQKIFIPFLQLGRRLGGLEEERIQEASSQK